MKKKTIFYVLVIVGIVLLAAGLCLLKVIGTDETVPYVCIGFGCGIFGHGFGEIISRKARNKDPEMAKQMDIELNDERNMAIRNCAQAKAYNIMIPVFGALFFSFALMKVDMVVILLLVAAYIFICGCSIYYRIKYEKEM